jgi:hypothetical protein
VFPKSTRRENKASAVLNIIVGDVGQEVSDIELKLSNTSTSAGLPTGGTGIL